MQPQGRKEILEAIVINAGTAIVAALVAWGVELAKAKTVAKTSAKPEVPTIVLPHQKKGT
jgi:hypothetical protein